jgi:hypothetical protein
MSGTSLISGRRFTKQLAAALAVAVALVVPAGALGIGAATSAATPKLSSKLLTIAQMPTGWSVVSLKSGKVGCLGDLLQPKGVTLTSTASINFSSKAGVPVVEEKLATYANTKTGYNKIVANLAACKHFSGSLNGLSFPLQSGHPTCQAWSGEGSPDGTATPAVLAGVQG